MGNNQTKKQINFEDMQFIIKNYENYIIINTLFENEQSCLIPHTLPIDKEEVVINKFLNTNKNINIAIYGKNCNDENVLKKYNQLYDLGFTNLYIYNSGLFEWLLLQDIYGEQLFPTTTKQRDLLKYKPNKILNVPLIEY